VAFREEIVSNDMHYYRIVGLVESSILHGLILYIGEESEMMLLLNFDSIFIIKFENMVD